MNWKVGQGDLCAISPMQAVACGSVRVGHQNLSSKVGQPNRSPECGHSFCLRCITHHLDTIQEVVRTSHETFTLSSSFRLIASGRGRRLRTARLKLYAAAVSPKD